MSWELEEAIGYYKKQGAPGDQSAVIALLKEIQQELGGIPEQMLGVLAEAFGVKESYFLALIKRIPSLRLADSHRLEICAGPNCSKRGKLAEFAERNLPGNVQLKFVPCMRMCGKGPNLRWDGKVYHQADEQLLRELMKG